jgi:plastocyanin
MIRGIAISAALAALAAPAWAGDLVVTVTTPDGKPLPDAVVTIPATPGAPKPNFAWKPEIAQKDKTFIPFVLIAPVGAVVSFPNLDKFRHHVYSFSKGNTFEIDLYGKDETRSAPPFKTPGTVALGCNIHDEMVAFVRVVDTPWAAKTDMAGHAEIREAPDGKVKVTVWHPYARGKDQTVTAEATLAAGAFTALAVVVQAAPAPMHRH